MACESKRISELPGVTRVYPNDLIPIVQDGTNKYITAKDLLGCHDHSGDDCCCSQALSKAITALDFSRTAMDLANKAFDKACLVSTRLAALEEKVNEHDTLICDIRSNITRIFNQLEELEDNLKLKIEYSSDTDNKYYKFILGNSTIDTLPVPIPTTNFESGDGKPADAKEVWRRLRDFKGEVSKNLTFRAGRFGADDTIHDSEYYNGLNPRTVNIPTRLGHLTDVNANNPSSGDVLYYSGTEWVNVPIATLIAQNLDCEAVKACFLTENFNVAPLVVTLEYNERVANFAVTSSGAWKIQKVTSGDNVFTASILDNVHLNPGTNLPLVITAGSDNTTGQNREVEWNVIPWITVPGLIETQRIKVILKPQSTPPTPTNRTITYNISGGLTNSIKVNNEVVGNGGQKTAPDGSNYTVPIVSNDSGYRIASVTPSAGTYNNGTLTINPITSDVTVLVVLEEIPAGTHNVTYVVDGDASKITNLPNSPVTVTNGLSYTYTPTIELGYEIPTNGVTFNPTGNGSYDGTTITIPQGVTTDTTVTIRVVAEGQTFITVNPDNITVPEGETTISDDEIEVSTTCAGGQINVRNLPTGITAVEENGYLKITVQDTVLTGDYLFEVYDECLSTPLTVTVHVVSSWLEDINLGINGNLFNALGVAEKRFDGNRTAITPGVSDPFAASAYNNGSTMSYTINLGLVPLEYSDILDFNQRLWLVSEVDNSHSLEVKLADFDNSYVQEHDSLMYPFIANAIINSNNELEVSISCLPSDFNKSITTDTDSWGNSGLVLTDSYVQRRLYLELRDTNGTTVLDRTRSYTESTFRRESYCNVLFNNRINSCANATMATSSIDIPITSGYYIGNSDETTSRVTPCAAWLADSNHKYPEYAVKVYEADSAGGTSTEVTNNVSINYVVNSEVVTLQISNLTDGKFYQVELTTVPVDSTPALTSISTWYAYTEDRFIGKFESVNTSLLDLLPTYEYTKEGWNDPRPLIPQPPVPLKITRNIGPWNETSTNRHLIILSDAQGISDVTAVYENIFTGVSDSCPIHDLLAYSGDELQAKWDEILLDNNDGGTGCKTFIIKYHPSEAPSETRWSIFFLDPLGDVTVTLT